MKKETKRTRGFLEIRKFQKQLVGIDTTISGSFDWL
jgi:hypothetical protein